MYFISLLQIVCLFIVPIVLLVTGVIPGRFRLLVLGIISAVIAGITIQERWTLSQLGIRTDNLAQGIIPYLIFTCAGLCVLFVLAKLLGRRPIQTWWKKSHFLYLFLPISVVQEFAFRGFLIPKLESIITSVVLVIFVNALLFAFLHVIYPHPLINVPLGFLAGIGFTAMYVFYPNLLLVTVSHSVLNFAAVLYSFFSFQEKEHT